MNNEHHVFLVEPMRSLRFTVYEILGYFVPGIVGTAGLFVLAWAAFTPQTPLPIADYSISKEQCAILLFVAYFIGHLVQGLCNYHPSPENRAERNPKHAPVLSNARKALSENCGIDANSYDLRQIASLCQALLADAGKTDEHEVFLYREGFYRGSSASYLFLASSLLFRIVRGGASVNFRGRVHVLHLAPQVFAVILSLGMCFVFYQRYLRFASYRINNLLNFVCVQDAKSNTKEHGPAATVNAPDSPESEQDKSQEEE